MHIYTTPIIPIKNTITKPIIIITFKEVEKISLSFDILLRPTSNVIYRLIADVKEIDNIDQLIKDNKIEAINNYYSFEVSGLLVSNVHVSITRLQDGVEGKVLLGGIETKTVRAGSSYTLSDITEITYAGVNYKLSRIVVNGVQVEEGSFTKVMTDKQFTDVPGGNDEVQLYYSVAPAEG